MIKYLLLIILTFTGYNHVLANDTEKFDLDSRVIGFLTEQFDDQNLNFEISYDSTYKLKKILNSKSRIKSIEYPYFSKRTRGMKILVIFEDDDKVDLYGKFTKFYNIPTATRNIRNGDIVSESDFKLMRFTNINHEDPVLLDPHKIIGKKTKSNISIGKFFYERDLKNPPVIKEGDVITMQYVHGSIILKTVGIALSTGAVGDKIRVKNEKSGIVVFGEILDKNLVIVGEND